MEAFLHILIGGLIVGGTIYLKQRYLSFTAQVPRDYTDAGPALELRHHLNGEMICEGVIFGPTGRVASRFVGDFDIRWQDDTAVMSERFLYDSGDVQRRQWNLVVAANGSITARADDVVGIGTGQQYGSAVSLHYRLRLPENAGGHVLSATDWMYLTPNGTIVNRSQFRKYGIKVAELVATMRRKEDT